MSFMPRRAFIVSHTHWDREWYLTFSQFRVNLVRVIRQLLDRLEQDQDFKHFLLDGQVVVLEDYLEVHPEDEARIRSLVEHGKLSLGPWYMLPDEFLISAEAHVRNLLIGRRAAIRFGGAQLCGYMPDSFGHIAQMPQLLKQAGISSFIYTRGNGSELDELGSEYRWQAPDGSTVLAINQCDGYCNAGGLGFAEIWHAHTRREVNQDRAVEHVTKLFSKMGEKSTCEDVLLNNGCDHFPPQQSFSEIMTALRGAFPETEFKHTSLAEYIAAIELVDLPLKHYQGELLGGRAHYLLTGVWSARMYLKQQNDQAQTVLEGYQEPLAAYSHFIHGMEYPAGLLALSWKQLLKNHPHDSICGCSIDEVHREMLPRFSGVIEGARQDCMHRMEQLCPTFAKDAADDRETVLTVFNPLPYRATKVIRRLVVLQPLGYNLDSLQVVDEAGNPCEFTVLKRWFVERFWGIDYRTMFSAAEQVEKLETYLDAFSERIIKSEDEKDSADCFLLLEFLAEDLPATGHHNYRIVEATSTSAAIQDVGLTTQGKVLENSIVRVTVHEDASFDLLDKRTGEVYAGLNTLASRADVGDEYDFAPCPHSQEFKSQGSQGKLQANSSTLAGAIKVEFTWQLPASINIDRTRRSEQCTANLARFAISLQQNSALVNVELQFDNQAQDHRLQALFPDLAQSTQVFSGGHFFINTRPVEIKSEPGWAQQPGDTYPQQGFSYVQGGNRGLAIFSQGLPEITPLSDPPGLAGIGLTLLRSVGWLSRDDLSSRNGNAGPTIPTPDAQCLGQSRFRYAVLPLGSRQTTNIYREYQSWRCPPLVIQGTADQAVKGTTGLLEVISGQGIVTAIKAAEDCERLVIRIFNPLAVADQTILKFPPGLKSAWQCDLIEEPTQLLKPLSVTELHIDLSAHEIQTIVCELG